MAYRCRIDNFFGINNVDVVAASNLNGTGTIYNNSPAQGIRTNWVQTPTDRSNGDYLWPAGWSTPQTFGNLLENNLRILTSNPTLDVESANVQGRFTLTVVFQDGSTASRLNNAEYVSPITDYYYTPPASIVINYRVNRSGFGLAGFSHTINIQNNTAIQIRTVTEYNTFFDSIGLPSFEITGFTANNSYGGSITPATPTIVCIDTSGTTSATTSTAVVSPSMTYSVVNMIVDNSPDLVFNQVSTTEPTERGIGDGWFNPDNNQLHIYTEDD